MQMRASMGVEMSQDLKMFGRLSEADAKAFVDAVVFDENGLVPAIAQKHDTREVLMLAWMNREALFETLTKGRVCYFSRQRQALWRKGEQSGNTQQLMQVRLDCDGDTVLVIVDQKGPACHTGREHCFFQSVSDGAMVPSTKPVMDPAEMYGDKA